VRSRAETTLEHEQMLELRDDPQHTGLVHEQHPSGDAADEHPADTVDEGDHAAEGGFLEHLVHKALE
jgi:hypothetical protein